VKTEAIPEAPTLTAAVDPGASEPGTADRDSAVRAEAGLTPPTADVEQRGGLDFTRVLPAPAAGPGIDRPPSPAATGDGTLAPPPEGLAAPVEAVVAQTAVRKAPEPDTVDLAEDAATAEPYAESLEVVEVSATNDTGAATIEAEEIAQLVALGDAALARDRLLLPEEKSAFSYYQRALNLDAGDAAALQGLGRIVDRYLSLAHRALRAEDFERAERYAGRALRVSPQNAGAQRLREQVAEAAAQAEADAAAAALAAARASRMAAEIPPPEPVEPKKPKVTSFERLMRNVDGHAFPFDR
jgi:hypothetical protein